MAKNKLMGGFEIQKGVEIPGWSKLCDAMESGDSVLLDSRDERGCLVARINSRSGYKAVTRKEGDKFRVWKCEEQP